MARNGRLGLAHGVIGIALAAAAQVASSDPGGLCPSAVLQEWLDEARVEQGAPGAALGVSVEGGCEWYGASGLANIDTGAPMVPSDRFRIGSVTKTFTATVVLHLVEEGLLDLDDTLAEWMPEYPDWATITLRQLLSHTSGIYDYIGHPDLAWDQPIEPAALVALAAERPLDFEPGSRWAYSNTGFIILGLIVERATGGAWAGELRTRVLDPLALADTFVESDEEIPGGYVRGYRSGSTDATDLIHPDVVWSTGGIVSNAGDLTRFARALFGAELLDPATVATMVAPTVLNDGTTADYGLAVNIWDSEWGQFLGHEGTMSGFRTCFGSLADRDASIAVLLNEEYAQPCDIALPTWAMALTSYPYAIAAAAHQPGAEDTSWVSDAVLHNTGREEAWVELRFHRRGSDGSDAAGEVVRIGPSRSLELADVVATILGHDQASGTVLLISSQPLVVTSRTYNDAATGTFGQYIPGVPQDEWISGTEPVVLLQLTGTDRYRTNIGFANLGPDELQLMVDLFAADASSVDTLSATLEPYSYDQLNDVFADKTMVEDGYAVVRAASEDATYLAYASVVDNATGDPVYIAPVEASSELVYVPAAAHVGGVGDTSWRTDLEVYSCGDVQASYRVEWLPASRDNTEPVSQAFTLDRGECVRYGDVVEEVFEAAGAGALRVSVDAGQVMVTSRTYNDLGDRTYGQLIPGFTVAEALAEGDLARLVGLAYSTDPDQGFRTNLGLVNVTGEPIDVLVYLYLSDFTLLDYLSYTLEPYAYFQQTDVFAQVTDEDVGDGFAIIASWTPGAQYFAWASVVDNRSGDPVFIPAQKTTGT